MMINLGDLIHVDQVRVYTILTYLMPPCLRKAVRSQDLYFKVFLTYSRVLMSTGHSPNQTSLIQ
jgi:hypothetical protein